MLLALDIDDEVVVEGEPLVEDEAEAELKRVAQRVHFEGLLECMGFSVGTQNLNVLFAFGRGVLAVELLLGLAPPLAQILMVFRVGLEELVADQLNKQTVT